VTPASGVWRTKQFFHVLVRKARKAMLALEDIIDNWTLGVGFIAVQTVDADCHILSPSGIYELE
jgi:hypothetical protein